MRMAAARASDYENDCKKEARAQSQHVKFIDENGGGPVCGYESRNRKKATGPLEMR